MTVPLGRMLSLLALACLVPACGGGGDTVINNTLLPSSTKIWGKAELAEFENAGYASLPQMAVDADGNALLVWDQYDGAHSNVLAGRFPVAAGLALPELIEFDNAGNAFVTGIAVDPAGNAMAVYNQSDGTRFNVWANRYVAGVGWGVPELLETDNAGDAEEAGVALDRLGNGLAVWIQSDGTRFNIWANRYTVGVGWGTAELLETDNAGLAINPKVAFDPAGNALAVWAQSDGVRTNLWGNRYTMGSGWSGAQLLETDNAGGVDIPDLATDSNGNAIAVWAQSDGSRYQLRAARYTPGTGWGAPQIIDAPDTGTSFGARLAGDATGNAIAVWVRYDGTRNNLWTSRYSAGSGWATARRLETNNAGGVLSPQVSFDVDGNAMAVWRQSDGAHEHIWAAYYVANTGWQTPQVLDTNFNGDANDPQVGFDPQGRALAVWHQSDGVQESLWINRFR